MLLNGLVLAALSTTAFFIIFRKLPRKVRRFIRKHTLLADAVALLLTYMLFGGTLTALVAAAMVGLFTSALLHLANHKNDFIFLYDWCEVVKTKLSELKVFLKEFNDSHMEKKAKEATESVNA